MRELTRHIVDGDSANHQLKIEVTDEPGSGGANHRYSIKGFCTTNNTSWDGSDHHSTTVLFQNGPIKEVGVNGLTHEALLAILIDRMESFQDGPYACNENAQALQHLENALSALQCRTRNRIERDVEGTHLK